MSYIDLPLKFAKTGTMTYAYREAGPTDQRPLVMLHHLSATLDNWRQPVLIVNGDHDAMVPTENSYVLEKMFPNSQLHIYPDSGHMSIFQNASNFATRTVKFLQA